MKKKHNSHYIFGLLGILVLIFLLVVGTQYFQSQYIIDETEAFETTQSYVDGRIIANPFLEDIDGNTQSTNPTKKFGSDALEFSFPTHYTIRIINGSTIDVIPHESTDSLDCSSFEDDEDQALCTREHRSPDIRVMLASLDEENTIDSSDDVKQMRINGELWEKRVDQDELGGAVLYQRSIVDGRVLTVSYRYIDTDTGPSFDKLQEVYGEHYLLSASEQNQLVLDIIKSLKVK